ncbi:MAG: DNA-binding NarL/FixJ family response regulator [Porticoccus sp.]
MIPRLKQMLVVNGISNRSESALSQLSPRELQIAELITNGKRANDVSEALVISPKTINTYKSGYMKNLASPMMWS